MKTYLFDLDLKTTTDLIKNLPINSIQSYSDPNKLLKYAHKDALIFFYNYHYRKILKEFNNTLPNLKMSTLCENRINQLEILDNITNYKINRQFLKSITKKITLEPNKIYKVGNDQQGNNKYTFPETKEINIHQENLIIEDFIQGRSIRILFIGNQIFAIEHQSPHKIKNINPIETIIQPPIELLKDTIKIKSFLDQNQYFSPTIGLDYIYSENKIAFLELNDMCGIPEQLQNIFSKELENIIKGNIK